MKIMFTDFIGGLIIAFIIMYTGIMISIPGVAVIILCTYIIILLSFVGGAIFIDYKEKRRDDELMFELPFKEWFNKLLIKVKLRKEEVIEEEEEPYREKVTNWKERIENE